LIDLVAKRVKRGLHLVGAADDKRTGSDSGDAPAMAVEIENATLRYPLGAFDRGSLKTTLFAFLGGRRPPKTLYVDALRDFNLRVTQGERVAIIGHNGSGKSTLLRTLAGIYPLSAGKVTVFGRISALLDNTLGFESEATGRENIYYRGTTMGLSRRELQKHEQEIVDFADIGEFIDLPMRTYSAGMCVRLGFSVSTQFSPDILLIDEIFGAGDAAFAKKALSRMMNIVEHAGIVIIATHDLGLVERVCKRVIWLERGSIVMDGAPESVLPEYRKHMLGAVS
jgi:lipopolysaccharide transport system ATP-binding protein